jgi:hypothetical protein
MLLYILSNKTISDVQKDFNSAYPFLKIDFYKTVEPGFSRKHLAPTMAVKGAGLKHEGVLEVTDLMTVGQLEKTFKEKFGLQVQVSRKSGNLWLETTISDTWTLKQQNDHGRELSHRNDASSIGGDEVDYD